MKVYFDTAILLKLYAPEKDSPSTVELVKSYGKPILLTLFHETEIRNALRLKCYRKEITQEVLDRALRDWKRDVEEGLFEKNALDWSEVFHQTEWLSARYALETNCRTLDGLHVASALMLNCKIFVSFDQKQRLLATKAGLKLSPAAF